MMLTCRISVPVTRHCEALFRIEHEMATQYADLEAFLPLGVPGRFHSRKLGI